MHSSRRKGFVRHIWTGTKGDHWVVSFQLAGLQEHELSRYREVICPAGTQSYDQANREGFRKLHQWLIRKKHSANAAESPWLDQRLTEILDALERERAKVLGE